MMNKHECFKAWAPDDSIWSVWAKPVLFAYITENLPAAESTTLPEAQDLGAPPPVSERTAIFLDLPGADAVNIAVVWAAIGYRPVPVYNAVPGQSGLPTGSPANEVVDVRSILYAIKAAAPLLAQVQLPPDAPPVFLLDSNRRIGVRSAGVGAFDNRSISLPTDFPSAAFLLSHGIRRVMLVSASSSLWPQADLAHTLRRYQEGGIEIVSKLVTSFELARPIRVTSPAWYRWPFQRFLAVLGLRRNFLGGFGGTLPEPSAG